MKTKKLSSSAIKRNSIIDRFIRKFSRIPEKNWTESAFVNGAGQKCVMGHLGVRNYFDKGKNSEAVALCSLFNRKSVNLGYEEIVGINNGYFNRFDFSQNSPRARVLAALKGLKSK